MPEAGPLADVRGEATDAEGQDHLLILAFVLFPAFHDRPLTTRAARLFHDIVEHRSTQESLEYLSYLRTDDSVQAWI